MAQEFAPDAKWYGMLADDMFPATHGFDEEMIATAVPFSLGCCHGGPGKAWPGSIPGLMIWGRALLDAVGWWAPPGMIHAGLDETWKRLSMAAGVAQYRADVLVVHKQWQDKARPYDFTDKEPRRHWGKDLAILDRWTTAPDGLAAAVKRIRHAMEGYDARTA